MAFVTGSHKYGKPTKKSDIDVVIYMQPADLELLLFVSGNKKCGYNEKDPTQASLMFGNLNLIVHTDPEKYNLWKEATVACYELPQLDRDEAIKIFRRICKDDEPE